MGIPRANRCSSWTTTKISARDWGALPAVGLVLSMFGTGGAALHLSVVQCLKTEILQCSTEFIICFTCVSFSENYVKYFMEHALHFFNGYPLLGFPLFPHALRLTGRCLIFSCVGQMAPGKLHAAWQKLVAPVRKRVNHENCNPAKRAHTYIHFLEIIKYYKDFRHI